MSMMRGILSLLLCLSINYKTFAQAPQPENRPSDPVSYIDFQLDGPIPAMDKTDLVIKPDFCKKGNGSVHISPGPEKKEWTFSLDGRSFQSVDAFTNLASGSYKLHILDAYGNTYTRTFEIPAVSAVQLDEISITASDCLHPTGMIQISLDGGEEPYTFSLSSRAVQSEPEFQDLADGQYFLTITDALGCTLDTTITIPRMACPVYIPNVFSPNGDGVNDLFQIKVAGDENILVTRFFIFDRWGNNVYKKYNLRLHSDAEWWDGTYKHFTSSAGSFNYYLEIEFENGERATYKGDVTLIR